MGVIEDRHGTTTRDTRCRRGFGRKSLGYLDNEKHRQVWLKRSFGTKDLKEANVRAKLVQIEFDKIIASAEGQLRTQQIKATARLQL
jgi:hypothetical protein